MKASIGRIIHFVNVYGEHMPAIITYVYPDDPEQRVDLTVFDRPHIRSLTEIPLLWAAEQIPFHEDESESWHWPERVVDE
jgi:hypothetical protein